MNILPIESQSTPKEYSLQELLDTFFLSIRISPNTVKSYRFSLNTFFKWYADSLSDSLTSETIIKYLSSDLFNLNYQRNPNGSGRVSTSTQSVYFAAIKRFFRWLKVKKIYPDITEGIEMKNEDAGYYIRKPFTANEIRTLLDSINISRINGLRNFAMINLMARTGIREIEVHRANRGDIKDTDNDIHTNGGKILFYIQRKGKRAKEDFVILTKEAYGSISDYLMWRNPIEAGDPLFISHGNNKRGERLGIRTIQDMIYRQLKKSGLKKECLSGHSIRHFFATQLIEKNVNIEKIRIALGHKSIVTTSRYTKGIDRLSNPVEEQIEI